MTNPFRAEIDAMLRSQADDAERAVAERAGIPLAELRAMSLAQQMTIAAQFVVVTGPPECTLDGETLRYESKVMVLTAEEYEAWCRGRAP